MQLPHRGGSPLGADNLSRDGEEGTRAPRLAIVGCRGIPANYGGFETFAEEIGQRLAARGIEVTVFCEGPRGARSEIHRGVHLRFAPAPKFGPLETLIYDFVSLWRSRRGYDVVYMLGYTSSILCAVSRLWRNEVWINMDGLEWKRSKWPWYGRLFLRVMEASAMKTGNLLIADSQAIRSYLEERYTRRPPCRVISYGCDLPDSDPSQEALAELDLIAADYCLIVARLEPENHIEEMILGFRDSGLPGSLVIIGNHLSGTGYVRRLLRLAGPDVRFLGGIYDRELLVAIRSHAKVYLHGHSVGGTNPSLLESMACGSAVIAHDNAFNREVAADCGLYFADAAELALGLRSYQEHDDFREKCGELARDRVREAYRWKEVTDRYEKLLGGRVHGSDPD